MAKYQRISESICYLTLALMVLYCLLSSAVVVSSKSVGAAAAAAEEELEEHAMEKRELPVLDLDDLAQLGITEAELGPFLEKYAVPAKKFGKPNKFRFRFRFRQ